MTKFGEDAQLNIVCTVVIKEKGKFLLVQETKPEVAGLWNFPSGKMEFGENPMQGAIREAKEETGYDVEIVNLIDVVFKYWPDMPGATVRFIFSGKTKSKKPSPINSEIACAKWFTPQEIKKMGKAGKLRNNILLERIKNFDKKKSCSKISI